MWQKFKGKRLSTKRCVDNIIDVYRSASDSDLVNGCEWYEVAMQTTFGKKLKDMSEEDRMKAAGVIAAVSPLKSWSHNMEIARSIIIDGKYEGHTNAMLNKARRIMGLDAPNPGDIVDILSGDKIKSFFLNLIGHKSVVTIDRHAISICLGRSIGDNEGNITSNQYLFFQRCYNIAADILGFKTPYELQAVTWLTWRRIKNEI